jgi:hypothetical protein
MGQFDPDAMDEEQEEETLNQLPLEERSASLRSQDLEL